MVGGVDLAYERYDGHGHAAATSCRIGAVAKEGFRIMMVSAKLVTELYLCRKQMARRAPPPIQLGRAPRHGEITIARPTSPPTFTLPCLHYLACKVSQPPK